MKARYAMEYGALRAALAVFAVLPVDAASAGGAALLGAVGPRMGISKVARQNLARAFPHWTREQVENAVRGMWRHFGRVIGEYPHLEYIAKNRCRFLTPDIFPSLRAAGGVVYFSAHIGNWEVLPPALWFGQQVPLHSAYRAPNNPMVDKLIVSLRSFGGRLKSFGKHRKGLAEILRTVQGGEPVGMLIDQKMNTGIEVPFMGRPAMTSTAFVEIAKKVGCPLVPGRIIRTKGCHFDIEILPPVPTEGRDTLAILGDVHALLESWVREHPEQWLWLHRRWKKDS